MLLINEILEKIVSSYSSILKENLVGVYLHGSLAMNCFNKDTSDIDFLVAVKEKPGFSQLRKLVDILIKLSDRGPKKGFEMSVLLEEDAKYFKYPTPFVLHYSDFHKDKYVRDPNYICGDSKDKDLAAHIVVLKERGICLIGEPINHVFGTVPKEYYLDSIRNDVFDAREEILSNSIYFVLNLSRVLYFLKEEKVCSKKEGGQWALINLPEKYVDIIQGALNSYENPSVSFHKHKERLVDFADFMLGQIEF